MKIFLQKLKKHIDRFGIILYTNIRRLELPQLLLRFR